MRRRIVLIITVVVLLLVALLLVKVYLEKKNTKSNRQITEELTSLSKPVIEALDKKDYKTLKELFVKEQQDNINDKYILDLLPAKYLKEKDGLEAKDFFCKPVSVLNKEYLDELETSRKTIEENNEYELKVIVEFGINGDKTFRQKWILDFVKEGNEFKMYEIGTIVNTLSEKE